MEANESPFGLPSFRIWGSPFGMACCAMVHVASPSLSIPSLPRLPLGLVPPSQPETGSLRFGASLKLSYSMRMLSNGRSGRFGDLMGKPHASPSWALCVSSTASSVHGGESREGGFPEFLY
jgi:hypothetical protein